MHNGRDCKHGRCNGDCYMCDLEDSLNEIETLKSKIVSLFEIIDPIQDERDAMEAQMELMRDALKSVRDYGSASWDEWLIEKADKALAIPDGEATGKLKYVVGADALEKFADELVQIHNLAVISKSVVYAKEAAQTLREKAKQHGKDTENWRLQCAGVRK